MSMVGAPVFRWTSITTGTEVVYESLQTHAEDCLVLIPNKIHRHSSSNYRGSVQTSSLYTQAEKYIRSLVVHGGIWQRPNRLIMMLYEPQ